MQGFYFSPPVPATECEAFFEEPGSVPVARTATEARLA